MMLLTSFDPFGGSEKNYSMLAAELLCSRDDLDKAQIPVGYRESYEKLKEVLSEKHYDTVILVGQAGARGKVTVEKIAINWASATIEDNFRHLMHGEKLSLNGPDGIFSTVDVTRLVDNIRASGLDADVSYSAGTFVCNALYYQTLLDNPDKKIVFVHVPAKDAENSAAVLENIIDQLS